MENVRVMLGQLWPFLEAFVPGLSVFMPRDAVVGIIDSIEIGMNKELKADFKVYNVFQILGLAKELSEAALLRTKQERREAIWSLMELITDIENHMTREEFMTYSSDDLLPDNPQVGV